MFLVSENGYFLNKVKQQQIIVRQTNYSVNLENIKVSKAQLKIISKSNAVFNCGNLPSSVKKNKPKITLWKR